MNAASDMRQGRSVNRAEVSQAHGAVRASSESDCAGPRARRRPGAEATREKILEAARDQFAAYGFDRATIRGIASAVGVDPALVLHYFGSKAQLFGDAISIPVEPTEVLRRSTAAGFDGVGIDVVTIFLDIWEDSEIGPRMVALLRSAMTSDKALERVREYLGRWFFGPITRELDVADGELRATLVGSQLIGLAMLRYVARIEPLASVSQATLVAAVGPTVQRYLAGDLGNGSHPQ
jgi:AcrR family transcriptional regulator